VDDEAREQRRAVFITLFISAGNTGAIKVKHIALRKHRARGYTRCQPLQELLVFDWFQLLLINSTPVYLVQYFATVLDAKMSFDGPPHGVPLR
jgi:hypothetical protein